MTTRMDLKTRIIKSTYWYLGARTWTQAVSWIVTMILARLLAPADYGLFAMGFAAIAFLEVFQELGLGVGIIQRQGITKRQLSTIFWIVCGISLFLTLVAFAAAGPLARFYGEPRLQWILRALTVIFLLNALGTVPYNLLTKDINFRGRSLAEAAAVLVSAASSIILAYAGYGVWALVGGQVVRAAVRNLGMTWACNWIPGFEVHWREIKDIMKFSIRMAGSTLLGELLSVTNKAIIGRFLGSYNLGLYSMAMALGTNPLHKLSTQLINQLSLPVFSMLQREDETLRNYFLKITRYLALIGFPMQLGMVLVAHDLVVVMLSGKWLPIVGLFRVLCVAGLWYVLPLPCTPILVARGRADTQLQLAAAFFGLMTVACLIGVQFGLSGVAWAWALSYCPLRMVLLGLTLAELRLSVREYVKTISSPLIAALAMTAVVLGVGGGLPTPAGALEGLLRDVAVGAASYIAMLVLIDRRLGAELRSVVHSFAAASRA